MKKLRILTPVIAIVFALMACAQKPTFPSLNNQNGITTVYISKAMLAMAGKSNILNGVPVKDIDRLESVEVITAENQSVSQKIQDAMSEYTRNNPDLEILLQVNEKDNNVKIYGKPIAGSSNFSVMIIHVSESNENVLVVMKGVISPSTMENLNI